MFYFKIIICHGNVSNIGNSNGRKRSVGERNKLSRLSQYVRESSLRYNKHFPKVNDNKFTKKTLGLKD
jgi:hypothetical protein